MKFKIEYNKSLNAITCQYFGDVTFDVINQSSQQRFSHEKFPSLDYLISDYSEANLIKLQPEEVKDVVALDIEANKINPNLVVLLLMPNPLDFGMARMWQSYASPLNWTTHVFKSRAELNKFIKGISL